jgi:flagellar biosynthesis GTPase FlhF
MGNVNNKTKKGLKTLNKDSNSEKKKRTKNNKINTEFKEEKEKKEENEEVKKRKKEEKEKEKKINEEEKKIKFENYLKPEFDVILLEKCHDHFFYIDYLTNLINNKDNFKCPNCSIIYGILIDDILKGTISAYISDNIHCKGYKNIKTIIINYYFPSGKNYKGTSRECY